MCIRDRPKDAEHRREPVEVDQPLLGQPVRVEEVLVLHESCLLYTSDAADERSSVDLGGRRIIKKKKKD